MVVLYAREVADQPSQTAHGFSKEVHDYYAHYANNADAKIGAIFALNAALVALLLNDVPNACPAKTFTWLAVGAAVVAAGALVVAIYPRLGKSSPGVLFWEDVLALKMTKDEYADEVEKLTLSDVERAYATNNHIVATVLHEKFQMIRVGVWATSIAIVLAIASVAVA